MDIKKTMNSTKYWICDNDYVDNDFKVTDHSQIAGKYRRSAQGVGNINLKLNHKILSYFTT